MALIVAGQFFCYKSKVWRCLWINIYIYIYISVHGVNDFLQCKKSSPSAVSVMMSSLLVDPRYRCFVLFSKGDFSSFLAQIGGQRRRKKVIQSRGVEFFCDDFIFPTRSPPPLSLSFLLSSDGRFMASFKIKHYILILSPEKNSQPQGRWYTINRLIFFCSDADFAFDADFFCSDFGQWSCMDEQQSCKLKKSIACPNKCKLSTGLEFVFSP